MSYKLIGKGNLGTRLNRLFIRNRWTEYALEDTHPVDVVGIAVKPKDVKRACEEIAPYVRADSIVVSYAAGVKVETLESYLPQSPIVRCMPNICVSEGRGAAIWYGKVSSNTIMRLYDIMWGPVNTWVDDEAQLEKATLLFAGQPAFQAYMANTYIELARQAGFSEQVAKEMYASTLIGTGYLLQESDTKSIIKEVCSEKGVTERVIRSLKKDAINTQLKRSIFDGYMQLHHIVKKFN